MNMQRWQHLTWKWTAGVIAALVILCATLVGLFRLFAPLVPGYRTQVQVWASRALGRPVNIAAMGAQWGLYGPEVTLEKVELLSRDRQRVVVTAREIRLGYTLGALLHARLSRPNRIILIQPQLVLERDANGNFGIRGLEPASVATNWRKVATEIFAQNAQLRVRSGEITLLDRRRPTTPLLFSDIRLDVDNSADNHKLSGHLLLPAALGRSLSFAGGVQGQALKPDTWQWQTDMQGIALNVPQLLFYWPAFSGRLSSGLLDLSASVSGSGARVNRLSADINARQVIPTGYTPPHSGFSLLSGRLNWNRSATGWVLAGSNIELQHGQDIWPASNFNLQYVRGTDGNLSWSGDAGFLRLQDLVTLATWLPADALSDRERLLRLSPSGDLTNLSFQARWSGKSLDNWSLGGRFNNLGLHADGDIPGFSGLNGELKANQDDGSLQLDSQHATAMFPHLFRGALSATTLGALVKFHHDHQGWNISTDDFSAANADLQVQAKGSLLLPADGSSPLIDLQANAQNVNAKNKSVYFPVGIMSKQVVEWLDSAIVGGQVPSGSLVLRGKLDDFPFDNGRGLFDIRFHLINGTLDYAGGWPPVEHLEADVEFKNQGMNVAVQHGTLLDDDISGASARFVDLRRGILEIKGTARGSAATALTFLRSGPLKQRFGHSLESLKAKGRSDVSLSLALPVKHMQQFKLDGHARLQDVSVSMANLPKWQLSRLNGDVNFTADGVSSDKLQGMLLGEPLAISLRPDGKQDMTLITVEGGANAAFLSAALPEPFQKTLTGNAAWQLIGRISNHPTAHGQGLSFTLTSKLQGLGVDLPAPFGKAPESAVPLDASMSLTGDQRMLVQVRYGDNMNGLYRFNNENDGWRFDRGDLVLGAGPPVLPVAGGLMLTGSLPEFSLDAWKSYAVQSGASAEKLLPPFLRGLDVEVNHFTALGQAVDNLHVRLVRDISAWKLGLTSNAIAGQISLPYQVDAAHPIIADMQRVTWIRKATKPGSNPASVPLKPGDVPPLRIAVKQLRYNDMTLDNVQAELEQQPNGVNLKTLSISNPAFSLTSNGRWTAQADGAQQSTLVVQIKSSDLEKTLQSFGYAPGITGDQGELQASLSWGGGPFADILPTLNGKLHVQLKDGRLLEVKPGAGRLFGLLSINALPRRLLLNFSDVLGKGFGYDSIQGDFLIERGDAYTSDLVVSGPAAKIHMVGRIGLVKHDFNEALIVDSSVGSTLPVLGALAASSMGVGAVLFILTEIFKKPLTTAGEIRYRLTGTWDNPVLTKVVEPQPAANGRH